ncbi:nucleotidyl transferase AbiEii/AbiGii toxin family protein [Sciscionella marina]|uniref:nucleotidyl transferase AbiEii/AbiGii toxin family protein n=1 Tax=Sciscionella marina TaxID=508770 RepID=UPI0003A4B317|nr:nucleotidyl transferase AbiEii/AbiGii toxin family protein [Sciscionella marina]
MGTIGREWPPAGGMTPPYSGRDTTLSEFQPEVTTLFFELPSSHGFVLAGGGALIAQRLSDRPTRDLDFFASETAAVSRARTAFEHAAAVRGWHVECVHDGTTFCRLLVQGAEPLIVDIALDSKPEYPHVPSPAGPT